MQSTPQNPVQVLLWLFGVPGGLMLLTLVAKAIWFVAKASTKLDAIDALTAEFKDFRHEVRDTASEFEFSLAVVEMDMNVVQEKSGVKVRQYPERRVGAKDRRAS